MIWSQKTILMALKFFLNFDVQEIRTYIYISIFFTTCKEAQACMPVTISLETIDDLRSFTGREAYIHVVFFTKGELTDLSLNNHSRNDETRPYYLHFPCRISLPTVQRSMKFSDVSDDTHLTRILSAAASDLRPTFLIRI